MRVLLDTDVILDLIMAREPFAADAVELVDLSESGSFELYISAITPLNVFYIARKAKGSVDLRGSIEDLLNSVNVCPIDGPVLNAALTLPFTDFEDAVQHCSATASGLEAIVTRNVSDFKNSILPVFTPSDFISHIKSQPT